MKKIVIGSDHAGFERKAAIIEYLKFKGYEVTDYGTYSDQSVDYPDFAHKVAASVADGRFKNGILLCGSGNGVSMTANKHPHVRAALSWIPEIAQLGKEHNNANIVSIPARYVTDQEAISIVKAFLEADFEGGRHARRVNKIDL